MDHGSRSFEASLLYKTASLPSLDPLIEELQAIMDINGETLRRTDHVDDMFTVLTCDSVQILLAFSPDTLPVAHFLNASRPGAASLGESEILMRLTAIRAMVTVLVIERETAAVAPDAALKRNLCWDVTDCLFHNSDAELVFWTETDMLYAAEEFERASSYYAQQSEPTADCATSSAVLTEPKNLPHHFTVEPDVSASVQARMEARKIAAPTPDDAEGETPAPQSLTARLSLLISRLQRSISPRVWLRGSALACTVGTVALAALSSITSRIS